MNGHFNKRGRNQRRRQGVNPNRALDSNGPDVRIRGTAQQIYDKYQALARDATSSGDRVKAENYLQHAEHYFRLLRSIQGPQALPQDHAAGDIDADSDQPVIGDMRDQRQGQQAVDSDDSDAGREEVATETQPHDAGENVGDEPSAPDKRAESNENDGRRRRRRPRRPRDDAAPTDAADEAEPVTAG
ncbi:MAG: DUF4167 domain-containing protein [Parvularculaceae bacterium]